MDGLRPLTGPEIAAFREKILSYYRADRRSFPWRETDDPYAVYVSEIMLQQTQTSRVLPKYLEFLEALPTFVACAGVSFEELFRLWKGLGYNRRALALRECSRKIVNEYGGRLPATFEDLVSLPGIGRGTAGALLAFAYNRPVVFLETNIRRVFIHEFFPGAGSVHDRDILPLVEATLFREDPRNWYYALMDYGVMLARTTENPNRRSRHYTRQSNFEGSDRQIRGGILRLLSEAHQTTGDEIAAKLPFPKERIEYCLGELESEGFIVREPVVRFRKDSDS